MSKDALLRQQDGLGFKAERSFVQQDDIDLDYMCELLIEVAEEFAQSPFYLRVPEQALRDAAQNIRRAYASCRAGGAPGDDSLSRMREHLIVSGWRTLRMIMTQVQGRA